MLAILKKAAVFDPYPWWHKPYCFYGSSNGNNYWFKWNCPLKHGVRLPCENSFCRFISVNSFLDSFLGQFYSFYFFFKFSGKACLFFYSGASLIFPHFLVLSDNCKKLISVLWFGFLSKISNIFKPLNILSSGVFIFCKVLTPAFISFHAMRILDNTADFSQSHVFWKKAVNEKDCQQRSLKVCVT